MWRRLREGYWVMPALCVGVAGTLALALVRVDQDLQQRGFVLVFAGGPDSARSLLSTISTSMLSLAALTFSITMVVLQLASSQFSPRAIPTFLRDRQNQLTLGVFLATYVYALLALREIRGTEAPVEQFVPGLTIGLAFVLVLVSIGFFVAYIHHIATSIQVATILQRIEAETRRGMGREYRWDDDLDEPDPPDPLPWSLTHCVTAPRAGVLAEVDVTRLVERARERDVLVRVLARPGDFVPQGAPLLAVEGGDRDDSGWADHVGQVGRRDEHTDVTLGLRQLVDIAERALSPGINDPSTATQCLDHLHGLLRALATATYPRQVHLDAEVRPRLVTPQVQWGDHVGLVLDEIRLWGAGSLQCATGCSPWWMTCSPWRRRRDDSPWSSGSLCSPSRYGSVTRSPPPPVAEPSVHEGVDRSGQLDVRAAHPRPSPAAVVTVSAPADDGGVGRRKKAPTAAAMVAKTTTE